MTNQELEIFVHGCGRKPQVLIATPGDTLRIALVRTGFLKEGQNDILVFAGECDEALSEPDEIEEGADMHTPVDIDLSLEVLGIKQHHHVHCSPCRNIAVEVNFTGKTKRRRFSPSATVGVVAQWARKKFHLDPPTAAEYILQFCNSTDQPRSDKHLGELVREQCSLCFDLVKEITPQG
ncbi:MAG: hypothetical protein ABSH28_00370 [Acidobacteriota bacterium]|jgi:hypothetical protein